LLFLSIRTAKRRAPMDKIKLRIYEEKLLRRKREIFKSLRRLDEENAEVTGKKQLDWIDQAAR
jgi:hypothetical protein